MPASIVVCGVFFASDQLLWMKELSVGASTDFIWKMKKKKTVERWPDQKYIYFSFFFGTQCGKNLIIKEDNLSLEVTAYCGYTILLNIHDFTEKIMLRKRQKVNGYFQLLVELGEKKILG